MNAHPPSQPGPASRNGAIISGIVIIGLGIIFLLQNLGIFYLSNWWALFILLGTAASWGSAWHTYRTNGNRITQAVVGSFAGGLFPLAIALIFLLDLNWGTMWPVFLIIAGFAIMSRSLVSR